MTAVSSATLNYGPKISETEFNTRIRDLELQYEMPTDEQELAIKRGTMEAMVDYKLGQDFPKDRRDRLWKYQEGMHKTLVLHAFKAFLLRPWDPFGSMNKDLVGRVSKELSVQEIKQYFDYTDEEVKRILGRRYPLNK